MTNRCNLVQFETSAGPKTLLWNPTDAARSARTPFFSIEERQVSNCQK